MKYYNEICLSCKCFSCKKAYEYQDGFMGCIAWCKTGCELKELNKVTDCDNYEPRKL